jgi:hypothetical protein
MKVRMITNLGTVHAGLIGVDPTKCQDGMEVDVNDAAGQWLVRNRKAVAVEVKAVPPEPMKAVPPPAIHPEPKAKAKDSK